jgi:hypothetical protein
MNATVKMSSSADVREALKQLDAERASTAASLVELESDTNRILLTGDDVAAEKHEAKIAKARRAIARFDLQRPGLGQELADALAREEAAAKAKAQTEAIAARDALAKRVRDEYDAPARMIATFLRDWIAVDDLCRDAGVPTLHDELRTTPDRTEAAREEEYEVYVDENGADTEHEYPVGSYRLDDQGRKLNSLLQPLKPRPKRIRTRVIPAQHVRGESLPALTRITNLPGLKVGDDPIWSGGDLLLATEDVLRRLGRR